MAADDDHPLHIRGSHALYMTLKDHLKELEQAIDHPIDFSIAGGCGDGAKQIPLGRAGAICCPFDEQELTALGGAIMHPLALEPLMIITHPGNSIESLTTSQVREIMSGRIRNWKEVGGPDMKIVVVMRPHCAQRPEHWKTILPLEAWKPDITVNKFLKMITTVAKIPGAVGHLGTVLYNPAHMHVVKVDGIDPLKPDAIDKGYPFYRPISLLTGPKPRPEALRLVKQLRKSESRPVFLNKHLIPGNRLRP